MEYLWHAERKETNKGRLVGRSKGKQSIIPYIYNML